MAQYCDSKVLEKNWYNWLLSSKVPKLEYFRSQKSLWTKVIGPVLDNNGRPIIKNGVTAMDPSYSIRQHCIIGPEPIFFQSNDGEIEESVLKRLNDLKESGFYSLESDICDPFIILEVISNIKNEGYLLEEPVTESWQKILSDINLMCSGISKKFTLPDEDQKDLATDALMQVIGKLTRYKLVYTPGKAPVFNLLTTTIHRCMFSILNRKKNKKQNLNKLIEGIQNGVIHSEFRSLRIPLIK